MTEVRFYHLEQQSAAQVLPFLLTKAYEKGHRIVVKMGDAKNVQAMDAHLWTFVDDSFLPHGTAKSGHKEVQPIWLTEKDENLNEADVLILCDGALSDQIGDYTLCCEMLNGQDAEAVAGARARWKEYKEKGYEVTYWQQGDHGGWEKKA